MCKITDIAPFLGYAHNKEQTGKKKLRNVLKKDLYYNTGDLMRIDTFRYRAAMHHRYIITVIPNH